MGSIVSHIHDKIMEHGSLEKYQQSLKEAVHCSTPELSQEVLNKANRIGFSTYTEIEDLLWGLYKDQTCYNFEGQSIQYAKRSHYQEIGYTVISAEEYLKRFQL